jgi:iron complex outermembrane receptor protein
MWEPTESLAILGNYAYTDATLTKHSQPELGVGHRLPRVPQHSGRAAIRYRFQDGLLKGLSLGTGVTLSSSRHIQLPNTHKTNSFYRVDAQASYPLTENLQLTVNIQNLTNSKYYEPFLFLEDAVVAPGQPIAAFATIRATF